ncbi:hypothetical protein ACSBR2_000291 [Camellia fascicularis]
MSLFSTSSHDQYALMRLQQTTLAARRGEAAARQGEAATDEDNHIEAHEEQPKKTKLFFIHMVEHWDAEFYAKVNDDVYVNIGMWFILLD